MYAKVFTQIFDSSIAEDYRVRLVFEDLLKLADLNGVVDMTHESIARRTNVPLEIVNEAILKLESPDPKSRNPAEKGARLKRLDQHRDWGWLIVNHHIYRAIKNEEQRRESTKERVRKHRERKRLAKSGNTEALHGVTGALQSVSSASASASVSVPLRGSTEGDAERPSLKEVLLFADKVGLAPWKAEDWFNEMEGCGWLDYQHRPVKDWRKVLVRVKTKWEADGRPAGPPTNPNHKPVKRMETDSERINRELAKL